MDIINKFSKSSLIQQLLIVLIIILIILYMFGLFKNKENFNNMSKFMVNDNTNLYDDFYCNIYDKLHNCNNKNDILVEIIKNNSNIKETSTILDIGSGTGEMVNLLSKNYNIHGVDKSEPMIKLSKTKFPNGKFINADFLNNNISYNYDYTHLLCLNQMIYDIKNKKEFFINCYQILSYHGILVLHLVDINKFNRLVNACRVNNFNPNKFLKDKTVKSKIEFDNFKYTSDFKVDSNTNEGIINEIFEFNDGSVRKNEHKLFMENYKTILQYAKDSGFIVDGQIAIKNNDGEYIFILKKNI